MRKLLGAAYVLLALTGDARADVSLESMSGADAETELPQHVAPPPSEPPPVDAFVVTLPPPSELGLEEQLLLERCTACHPAANYQDKRYTGLRWRLVLMRMERVNGAVLLDGEAEIIIAKLTRDRPAAVADLLAEVAVGIGLAGAFAGMARWLFRRLLANKRPGSLI